MGHNIIKSIPRFSDTLQLRPHTATNAGHVGRTISIRQFCHNGNSPCSLEQIEETGDYIVRRRGGDFIQGPEV